MADYALFLPENKKAEGGHVFVATDKGLETIAGISRRWFPAVEVWPMVDQGKKELGIPDGFTTKDQSASIDSWIKADPARETRFKHIVHEFYRLEVWNRIRGDAIPDQRLANELASSTVLCGFSNSIRWLRRGLNIFNRRQKLYPDMVIDSSGFGPQTMAALSACLKAGRGKALYKILNCFQGVYLAERCELQGDDSAEENILGWVDQRVFEERAQA